MKNMLVTWMTWVVRGLGLIGLYALVRLMYLVWLREAATELDGEDLLFWLMIAACTLLMAVVLDGICKMFDS